MNRRAFLLGSVAALALPLPGARAAIYQGGERLFCPLYDHPRSIYLEPAPYLASMWDMRLEDLPRILNQGYPAGAIPHEARALWAKADPADVDQVRAWSREMHKRARLLNDGN